MGQKSIFLIVWLVAAVHAWGQPVSNGQKSQVLFTIKGNPVTTDEFTYLFKKNHLKKEDFTEKSVNEYLDLLINFKLKVAEAKTRGLDTTTAFRKELKSYTNELKKPYLAEKDELDRLTKEAYQRLTEEVKASHILITVKPDATPEDTLRAFQKVINIRARILAGADFGKLASELSEDPSAKSNGGNLGYFTVLQMVYPFEQAAYELKVGEISQPVRTRFGYHIIKVNDRRLARGEVEVSHILLRTGKSDDAKVKNKILDIYDQLQGGRNWAELCKEYSDDAATKESGGKLRPFGVGALAGVPEFEAVAFQLKEPGEISDPFQSAYGWHIVRLERKIPVPSFADMESSLKRRVSRDERLQITNHKLLEKKKQEFGFLEDNDARAALMALADSSLQKGKWKFKGDPALRAKRLFTIHGREYKAGEFISFIETSQRPNSEMPVNYMTQLLNRFSEDKLNDAEEDKLAAENPEFKSLLTEYREGILLFTIMENEVWNAGTTDTVSIKKYYEENKEKYSAGDRVRARVFATTDKKFYEEVKQKVTAHDSLRKDDLKKFKSIQPMRNYERGENKAVDRASWAIGLHDVEVDGTYYLVEIDNLVPPGIKTFAEARAQIVSDYQRIMEDRWIAVLKQKYPVKINNKGKKLVVTELTKSEI